MSKRPAQQTGTLDAHQLGPGEIELADGPIGRESKITCRREIVEVSVILQRRLQFIPGLPQFGVLQFQFNLVNLQFVKQPLRIGLGLRSPDL